jgi:hypothetical protein
MLRQLVMFKAEHKHCNVPQWYQPNLELAKWVNKQRTRKMRGRLSRDRIRRLDELGFAWAPFQEAWENMFRQLLAFKKEHGDCNVPQRYRTNPALGSWANDQRTAKSRGELSVERARRLEKVGFAWNVRDVAWEKMYRQLADFKSQHGHCDVSSYSGNRVLGRWATRQRRAKRSGTLSHGQVERLDVLGFHWVPLDQNWESMFRQLVEFKSHNGHCNVPARYAKDPVLGRWVSKQRASGLSGTLSADRAARLNELGLVWDPYTSAWEDMFRQLSGFRADNGHCNVPAKSSANRPLGMWVSTQRTARKSGTLTRDRKARLDALGFTWQFGRKSR